MTSPVKSPIVDGKRQCTKCLGEPKPLEEFYRKAPFWKRDDDGGPAGYMAECKDCFRLRQKFFRLRQKRGW